MKKNSLKQSLYSIKLQGFTLIEVLMAIAILGITSSLISYAVSQMITSNQGLAKEQNRRVELSRALDLIANDIKVSKVYQIGDTTRDQSPINAITTAGGTVILDMDIISGSVTNSSDNSSLACGGANTTKNRIIYSIKPAGTSDTQFFGPNIIYRYGLVSNSDGKIDCNGNLSNGLGYAIADGLSIVNSTRSIAEPTCQSTTYNFDGFYACLSENDGKVDRVSLALYGVTKGVKNGSTYSNAKTYGINRTIRTGDAPSTVANSSDWCTVPNLVGQTITDANTSIANAANVDTTKTTPKGLLANSIRTEVTSSDAIVINQTPAANTQLPCGNGLVTYTY